MIAGLLAITGLYLGLGGRPILLPFTVLLMGELGSISSPFFSARGESDSTGSSGTLALSAAFDRPARVRMTMGDLGRVAYFSAGDRRRFLVGVDVFFPTSVALLVAFGAAFAVAQVGVRAAAALGPVILTPFLVV